MKTVRSERQPWHLKARDFGGSKVHAEQDWRFQMFFEYLRISPSYTLATKCKDIGQLAKELGNSQQAALVWNTYQNVGNVFEMLYREWWLGRGIALFGVHSARPRVEDVQRMSASPSTDELLAASYGKLGQFISTRYKAQGMPESLLVSIPLRMKRTTILKQLKALLDANIPSQSPPKKVYELEKNKMRQSRLLMGLRLIYMRAARPDDELWRVASRAKISKKHNSLDPAAKKKTANTGEGRRMLTIMASRLKHDSLVIAENAAQGRFPSLEAVATSHFDFNQLGKRLQQVSRYEKMRKEQLLTKKKAGNVN